MHTGALGDIDNEVDVGVVVVVGTAGHLDVLVGHANVIGIHLKIFGGGHDREFDCTLMTESLIGPFPDRANLLDGGDTVVANENFGDDSVTALLADEIRDRASRRDIERVTAWQMRESARTKIVEETDELELLCAAATPRARTRAPARNGLPGTPPLAHIYLRPRDQAQPSASAFPPLTSFLIYCASDAAARAHTLTDEMRDFAVVECGHGCFCEAKCTSVVYFAERARQRALDE